MRNIMAGIIAVAVIAAALSFNTSAQSDAERQMKDRAEIEALMWKYTRSLDGYDPDGYAASYTTDGQFVAGANATKGHEFAVVADHEFGGDGTSPEAESDARLVVSVSKPNLLSIVATKRQHGMVCREEIHNVAIVGRSANACAGDMPNDSRVVGASVEHVEKGTAD